MKDNAALIELEIRARSRQKIDRKLRWVPAFARGGREGVFRRSFAACVLSLPSNNVVPDSIGPFGVDSLYDSAKVEYQNRYGFGFVETILFMLICRVIAEVLFNWLWPDEEEYSKGPERRKLAYKARADLRNRQP